MSHAPRRISSKRVGSKLYSVTGRPDDGVEADVGQLLTFEHPRFAAVVALDDTRCALGERGGQAADERVGRLDEVVVDRDDGVAALGPLGLRQPAHHALRRGGETLLRLELLERDRHAYVNNSGSAATSWRTTPFQYTGAARSTSDAFSCFWCVGAIGS